MIKPSENQKIVAVWLTLAEPLTYYELSALVQDRARALLMDDRMNYIMSKRISMAAAWALVAVPWGDRRPSPMPVGIPSESAQAIAPAA